MEGKEIVRFEINEPLSVVIVVFVVGFFVNLLTIGGCWVNSHYKVEAIKASSEQMEVYENGDLWGVRKVEGGGVNAKR